jgi:hypothetical protein
MEMYAGHGKGNFLIVSDGAVNRGKLSEIIEMQMLLFFVFKWLARKFEQNCDMHTLGNFDMCPNKVTSSISRICIQTTW